MIGIAIADALKNVDCDLPPLGELCGQSQVIFFEIFQIFNSAIVVKSLL